MKVSISKTILFVSLVLLSISLVLCNSVYIDYSIRRIIEIFAIITSVIYLIRFSIKSTIVKKSSLLVALVLFSFVGCMIYFSHRNVGLIIKDDPTITALLDGGVLCSYFFDKKNSINRPICICEKEYGNHLRHFCDF